MSYTQVWVSFTLKFYLSNNGLAWTQTTLSFPPVLPLEVEEIFNQYMNDPEVVKFVLVLALTQLIIVLFSSAGPYWSLTCFIH